MMMKIVFRITSHNIDVTEQINPYLGPNEDFYGHNVTPKMLGYETLTFHVINSIGTIYQHEFGSCDIINKTLS